LDLNLSLLRRCGDKRFLIASFAIYKQAKANPEPVLRQIVMELMHSKSFLYSDRLLSILRGMDDEVLENSPVIKRYFKNYPPPVSRKDTIRMYSRVLSRCGWELKDSPPGR
jgi:hypothetical protein